MVRKRPGQHSLRLRGDLPSAAAGVSGAKNALHKAQVLADSAGVPVTKVIHQTPNGQVTAVGGLSSSLTVTADVPLGAESPGIRRAEPEISVRTDAVVRWHTKGFGGYSINLADVVRGVAITTLLRNTQPPGEGAPPEATRILAVQETPVSVTMREGLTNGMLVFGAVLYRNLLLELRVVMEDAPGGGLIRGYFSQLRFTPTLYAPEVYITSRQVYELIAETDGVEFLEALPALWAEFLEGSPEERESVLFALDDAFLSPQDAVAILAPTIRRAFGRGAGTFTLPQTPDSGVTLVVHVHKVPAPRGSPTGQALPASVMNTYVEKRSSRFHALDTNGDDFHMDFLSTDIPPIPVNAEGTAMPRGTAYSLNRGASTPPDGTNDHFETVTTYAYAEGAVGVRNLSHPPDPELNSTLTAARRSADMVSGQKGALTKDTPHYAALRLALGATGRADTPDHTHFGEPSPVWPADTPIGDFTVVTAATPLTSTDRQDTTGARYLGALRALLQPGAALGPSAFSAPEFGFPDFEIADALLYAPPDVPSPELPLSAEVGAVLPRRWWYLVYYIREVVVFNGETPVGVRRYWGAYLSWEAMPWGLATHFTHQRPATGQVTLPGERGTTYTPYGQSQIPKSEIVIDWEGYSEERFTEYDLPATGDGLLYGEYPPGTA